MSSSKRPYRLTCSQNSGVRALRSLAVSFPDQCGSRQDLLQHENVEIHHVILEHMQGKDADFVILAAIADHFAAEGEEDQIVGTVPLLMDIANQFGPGPTFDTNGNFDISGSAKPLLRSASPSDQRHSTAECG